MACRTASLQLRKEELLVTDADSMTFVYLTTPLLQMGGEDTRRLVLAACLTLNFHVRLRWVDIIVSKLILMLTSDGP